MTSAAIRNLVDWAVGDDTKRHTDLLCVCPGSLPHFTFYVFETEDYEFPDREVEIKVSIQDATRSLQRTLEGR